MYACNLWSCDVLIVDFPDERQCLPPGITLAREAAERPQEITHVYRRHYPRSRTAADHLPIIVPLIPYKARAAAGIVVSGAKPGSISQKTPHTIVMCAQNCRRLPLRLT